MKKILSAVILSSCFFANAAFARQNYLCKDADRTVLVRVFVDQLRATMQKIDGSGRPAYDMLCEPGKGDNWIVCEEAEGRTFEFKVGGQTGVYHGSHRDTYLNCFKTSRD